MTKKEIPSPAMKSQPKKEIEKTVTHKGTVNLQRREREREEAKKKGRKKRKGYIITKRNEY